MTKVEAVKVFMKDNGGTATWVELYAGLKKYKPEIDQSVHWKAGIRGVVQREAKAGRVFVKVHDATYGLIRE